MKIELTPSDRALLEGLGNAIEQLAAELGQYNRTQREQKRTIVVNTTRPRNQGDY